MHPLKSGLKATQKALPRKVTVAESGTGRMVLHGEHKAIADRIKITAYNAEEWLLSAWNGTTRTRTMSATCCGPSLNCQATSGATTQASR